MNDDRLNSGYLNRGAFDGGPKTIDTIDEYGVPTIGVKLTATDPFWKKVADRVGMAILVPSIGAIAINFLGSQFLRDDWVGAGTDLIVVGLVVLCLTHLIRRVKRYLKFTPQELLIKRREFPWGHDWDVFELNQPVRFTMIPHDHALWEREENEFRKAKASRSGRAIKPDSLYQNSFHVCLEHFGQRHDLITVYGRKEATAILTRLKACLEINKARAGRTGSTATEPSQQWKQTPGAIPTLPAPDRTSSLY